MISVRVLFFAGLRDAMQGPELWVSMPVGTPAQELLHSLEDLNPDAAGLLGSVRVAVNRQMASREQELWDGDEVALLPPVSGG